jgi:hypothetical protein
VIGATAAPVSAQDFSAIVPAEYGSEYESLLSNPADLDRLYRLARRAEADADRSGSASGYRFAIRLYERMLLINPDLTAAALRLGEIHFRLGEYVDAGSYFRLAVTDPSLPPDIRALAERYLAEIEQELSQSQLSGRLTFGLKHQSNPSLEDEPFVFPEPQGSDFNIFAGLGLTHVYDPGWQPAHTFETTLDVSVQKYFELGEIDSTSVDITFGPRFRLDSYGVANTSIRPYLIFDASTLDGEWFTIETGLGIQATTAPTQMMRFSIDVSTIDIRNNPELGVSNPLDLLDGTKDQLTVSADFRLSPRLDLGLGVYFSERRYPLAPGEDTHTLQTGGTAFLRYRHAPLVDLGTDDWYLNLFMNYEQRETSDIRAGSIDRVVFLETWENQFILSSEIPVSPVASVIGGIGYTDKSSTFVAAEYSNWEAYIGFTQRF